MGKRSQPAFFFPDECGIDLKADTAKALKRSRKGAVKAKVQVFDCNRCGLSKLCKTPKMEVFGRGQKRILLVGEYPDGVDDRDGIPFSGKSGTLLRSSLETVGIDIDRDCYRVHAVSCFPGYNNKGKLKKPSDVQVKCCQSVLAETIKQVKPKLILCLGTIALKNVIQLNTEIKFNAPMMHGQCIPYHDLNCWVGGLFDPGFFESRKDDKFNPDDRNVFLFDLAKCLSKLGKPLPKPLDIEGNLFITDPDEAVQQLNFYSESESPVSFDYETTCLSAYAENADILSVQLSNEVESGIMIPLGMDNPETGNPYFNQVELSYVCNALRKFLISPAPKVVQGINMEETWSRQFFNIDRVENIIHDTMIGQRIVCSHSKTSLDWQVILMAGHAYKHSVDITKFSSQVLNDLVNYGCWDARYTLMAYYRQMRIIDKKEDLKRFNDLFQEGSLALASLKHNGVLIDKDELERFHEKYKAEQDRCLAEVQNNPEVRKFEAKEGKSFNTDSPAQVGKIIYNGYGIEPPKNTATGLGCTDEPTLQLVLSNTKNREVKSFLENVLRFRKTCSAVERASSYIELLDKDNFVHPNYNLFKVGTYRSSSNEPNIQNVFKHDPELYTFRKCIIAPPGMVILECDYGSLEVRIIAMGSGDRALIQQLIDGVDFHRKWAALLYEKSEADVTYDERYRTKNGFVFASFYGSNPESIARNMPEIKKEHVFEVQRLFWDEYAGIKRWQEENRKHYLKYGYLKGFTGFRCNGLLSYNQLSNYPIQGPAFHLLLNGLVHVEEDLVRGTFKDEDIPAYPIIEVHDSLDFYVDPVKIPRVVELVDDVMTKQYYDWQGDVPLVMEWECGKNWYDMGDLELTSCSKCGDNVAHSVKKTEEEKIFTCMICGGVRREKIS